MEAKFTGKKTSKEQSIEQALRRLKYLHTSLVPHREGRTIQNGHKIDERIVLTKGIQSANEERFSRVGRTSEKQCFLSLQPKTSRTPGDNKVKTRVLRRKQDAKKAIRTGRAPLQAYRVSSYSVAEEQIEPKSDSSVIISRDSVNRERISKSASGVSCTSDPYKCAQCFTNDFGEHTHVHKTKATKEYFTNMRINRVTFSARPSSYKVKSVYESKNIEVPKSCFFNGWGVRSKKESLSKGKTKDSIRHPAKETMDVTVGLKTLRLEPKREQPEYTEETIPQPPPTPVRQIDIKLPQGVVVKYKLPDDE